MKLHFINVIWGDCYLKTYLKFSLPTQLSEGNLPGICQKIPATYIFFITKNEKDLLEEDPLFHCLKKHIPVEFRIIDSLSKRTDYDRMTDCHRMAVIEANEEDAALVFLSPDAIFSTEVFHSVAQSVLEKKRVVAVCSTRLSYEGMEKAFQGMSRLSLNGQELTALALKHLHRRIKLSFLEKGMILNHPSQIYWKLDDQNLLVKAFHLHPILIWPENKKILPRTPVDTPHYIDAACPNFEKWEVISDSNSIAVFEMTADSQFSDMVTMPLTPFRFQKWGRKNLQKSSSFFSSQSIILGNGNRKPEWKKIEEEANKLIHSLQNFKVPYFINVSILVSIYYIKVLIKVLMGKKKISTHKIKAHLSHIKGNFVYYSR